MWLVIKTYLVNQIIPLLPFSQSKSLIPPSQTYWLCTAQTTTPPHIIRPHHTTYDLIPYYPLFSDSSPTSLDSFLHLKHTGHIPISCPLHTLFLLPRQCFLDNLMTHPLTSFRSLFQCHFPREGFSDAPPGPLYPPSLVYFTQHLSLSEILYNLIIMFISALLHPSN